MQSLINSKIKIFYFQNYLFLTPLFASKYSTLIRNTLYNSNRNCKLVGNTKIPEMKLRLNEEVSTEINFYINNLKKELKQGNNEEFYLNLYNFCKKMDYLSVNNCKIIFHSNFIFNKIKENILNENLIFLNNNSLNAKAVLSFLYLAECKNIDSLTREQNDKILLKVFSQLEKSHNDICLNELIDVVMMLAHFGITFNLSKIEHRLKKVSSHLSFKQLNNVMRGIRMSKNNKINEFKAKFVNCLIKPYLEMTLNEEFENQVIAFNNLCSLLPEFPLLETKTQIDEVLNNIKNNLKNQSNINVRTANNLINGLNYYLVDYQTDLSFLENIYDKISFNFQENPNISLPIVSILIKTISFLSKEFLPKEKHLKSIFEFIKKEIPFYVKKDLIVRETLYLYKLMLKTNYLDTDIVDLLYDYNVKELHLVNLNDFCFEEFKAVSKQVYTPEEYDRKLTVITDNALKTIKDNEKNGMIFTFELFYKSCFFLEKKNEITDEMFNCFMTKLNKCEQSNFEMSKVSMNLIKTFALNQNYIFDQYKITIIDKIFDLILQNFEEISIFDYSLCKLFIYLSEMNFCQNYKQTKEKREELLLMIIQKINNHNFNFYRGLKVVSENIGITITNNSLNSILQNSPVKDPINQYEHLILFTYILLKKDIDNKFDPDLFNQLLTYADHNKQIRFSIPFNLTFKIVKMFTEKKIKSPKLIKIFEDQLLKKLITKAGDLEMKEITSLMNLLSKKKLIRDNLLMLVQNFNLKH